MKKIKCIKYFDKNDFYYNKSKAYYNENKNTLYKNLYQKTNLISIKKEIKNRKIYLIKKRIS